MNKIYKIIKRMMVIKIIPTKIPIAIHCLLSKTLSKLLILYIVVEQTIEICNCLTIK